MIITHNSLSPLVRSTVEIDPDIRYYCNDVSKSCFIELQAQKLIRPNAFIGNIHLQICTFFYIYKYI